MEFVVKQRGDHLSSDFVMIESQLSSLNSLTASYRADLHRKEEELQRLQEALTDLEDNKNDFMENKGKCMKPECTAKTLHGSNEKHLDEFRQEGLMSSFVAIPFEDINDALEKIEEKIEQIQQDIKSLESSISSTEEQHTKLFAKKMEVKNES